MTTNTQARTGAWTPLRHRVFLALWLAQLGSNIGSWMQTVGGQWFLVEREASPLVVSLMQTANLGPALLLSLVAGVLADAWDRRRLLILTNVLAAAASIGLTVVAALGMLGAGGLLAFTVLIGAAVALGAPAWQAIQPDLVPREEIPAAAALGGVGVNVARAVGPALAGVLLALTTPRSCSASTRPASSPPRSCCCSGARPRPRRSIRSRSGRPSVRVAGTCFRPRASSACCCGRRCS
ncbi:MFS transporter [Propioniciclava coleopterorum]|uniref:MFS transporter n=1 Tax=Propioniciclava coleopterorum TaxID=2714937 RepID=A0A6G7Y7L2_9ACTN|nr:MFS transporter [Propioniciclava coleopterorum]